MPSLDSDSFIKINCDWWRTCNRLFPTTKQIIDDSLFSVTDYCWVYFGVRMFCIGVVIVMLSPDLTWMYALIKKVITNHNMWSIFSTNLQCCWNMVARSPNATHGSTGRPKVPPPMVRLATNEFFGFCRKYFRMKLDIKFTDIYVCPFALVPQ